MKLYWYLCLTHMVQVSAKEPDYEMGASGEAAEILSHLRQLKGIGVVFN